MDYLMVQFKWINSKNSEVNHIFILQQIKMMDKYPIQTGLHAQAATNIHSDAQFFRLNNYQSKSKFRLSSEMNFDTHCLSLEWNSYSVPRMDEFKCISAYNTNPEQMDIDN